MSNNQKTINLMVDYMLKHNMIALKSKYATRKYKYDSGAYMLCLQLFTMLTNFELVELEKFVKEIKTLEKN